ncbi:sensor histidine kinase [Vibrio sp. MACH09]|uniref:cache domain-containing protein n=1 Tax=unclassified Vibrio TaxID=2614977 RepID=UPI0014933A41|nr:MULTISPECIES: cache domain-containing protein [unclassified Vibrio]NOI65536.1 histidine kinase [Vibrio sp. 99-8-1]GLO61053.1 sensor histidine kinase [Vibrio sp. MACH09]
MPLKAKLILLTLIPLIMVSASISWIAIYQTKSLGAKEVEIFRQNLIKSRESALKDSVDLAFSAIKPIYENAQIDDDDAKQQVKAIINEMRFGSDGYFFVYDKQGTNIVHPILPELVGQNLIGLQDKNGNYLIEALLDQAQNGGGFHSYLWQKPSTNETVQKLGYVEWLDKWQWMIGTGLYIEDIHQDVAIMKDSVNQNIETTFFSVITILAFTVAVIIVLTLVINLHEHRLADKNLKDLAHKTVMFQEDEKKHLARELHDGINQLLVSSKCHLELLATKINLLPASKELGTHLDKSQHSLVIAINEVRRISHNLRPSALDDIGLEAALSTLINDFRSHSEHVEVDILFDTKDGKLKSEVATTLYRVTQESLTNIEKHANASTITVILQQMGNMLQLMIRDDGEGFDDLEASRQKGIGLRNMRERVEFIGGDFELSSEIGIGTEITVLLNLDGLMVWKNR